MATAYLTSDKDIYDGYEASDSESKIWRQDYPEFERLADNELIEDLDEDLPEVNDGTLAASLFKLPKRIVSTDLKGRVRALDRAEDPWVSELANLQWENEIIPNANSQAPFHRKWKDAVRKAAIYGSVPLITIFVERGDYTGSDFIVAQPQDVKLEAGKVSDYDSDVFYWDVYLTRLQVESMIERAKEEMIEEKANPEEKAYNKWYIANLQEVLKSNEEEGRDANEEHSEAQKEGVRKKGFKFCAVFQRGVNAPFYMFHKSTKKKVREWSNPDPTGDVPIHFLYCYQDFINPYGIGIVKLAGGTQNVLDYMRQADVLATQIGLRPPIQIGGDVESADLETIVNAQDAQWIVGNATVKREQLDSGIYQQLPSRINMYKSSLNNLLPMGDTSVSAGEGDPLQSKTPAGVKLAAANLSIDDGDFKDNLYVTYEAVASSMINTQFANMQGKDFMNLSDDERKVLTKAGIDFKPDANGNLSNELEIIWDEARAKFKFVMDAEQDKTKDDEKRLDGLLKVADLRKDDPETFDANLLKNNKRLNVGELFTDIIGLISDNDKILEDIGPEDQEQIEQEQAAKDQAAGGMQVEPPKMSVNYKDAPDDIKRQMEAKDGLVPSRMDTPQAIEQDLKQQQINAGKEKTMIDAHHKSIDQEQSAANAERQAITDAQQPNGEETDTPETTNEPEVSEEEQDEINVKAIMDHYNIDEALARGVNEAEKQGHDPADILDRLEARLMQEQGVGNE